MAEPEKKKHGGLIIGILMLAMLAAIILILFYMIPGRYQLNRTKAYSVDMQKTGFPLTGYAPWAEKQEKCADSQLVYMELRWADFEPQKGVFDTDFLESEFHVSEYAAENKHAVLRFVCDIPGKEEHADVPDWLLRETQGTYYANDCGSGYCPDYADPVFLEYHRQALTALAEWCNKSSFVAYVELGSIGHWGEWHCKDSDGSNLMPSAEICEQYADLYASVFYNAKLMTRRSYALAETEGFGLFNDMLGDPDSWEEWQKWLTEGGSEETSGEALPIVPMEDSWKTAPNGGEFTSSLELDELLGDRFSDTMEQVGDSHLSFIGPHCPAADDTGYDAILKRLGYRIYISELRTTFDFSQNALNVSLTWENAGSAPLYWDWPCTLQVYDRDGNLLCWQTLDIAFSKLVPGERIVTVMPVPYSDTIRKGYSLKLLITDFDGNEQDILAMDEEL